MSGYLALLCTRLGNAEGTLPPRLELREIPRMPLEAGQVRLRVKAAGLNFFDQLMLKGLYQFSPPLPFVPGAEAAGQVIEVGPEVTNWQIGDSVIASLRIGAFAEEAVTSAGTLLRKPDSYSFAEAAAFPVGAMTAWGALVARGQLQAGELLLVLGAGGGMGLAAVSLGHQLGARVAALASTPDKRLLTELAGADLALDGSRADWPGKLRSHYHGSPSVIFDPVGGDAFNRAWQVAGPQTRYLVIGFASGQLPRVPADYLQVTEASLIGVRAGEHLRRRPALVPAQRKFLQQWLDGTASPPQITECYPLADAYSALAQLAARQAGGKLVLEVG